jgi:hypothetical protein
LFKGYYAKGIKKELLESKRVHTEKNTIPLLISSRLLRSVNCGQVDLASWSPRRSLIKLYEVKLSSAPGLKQSRKIARSRRLIAELLDQNVLFEVL